MMGAYVQAVRCKLLARDGCSVLDAASRYALPTPPCAPHPPIFGCDPSVLTPRAASCSQARRGRPPSTSSRLLGAVSRRGELHVEGCSVGSRGRVFTREARGWGGWSGQDRSGGAAHLILSLFRHHLFSVAGCLHCLPGI